MEFVKGNPYFCENVEKIKSYPYLDEDVECDILIIGGGIDGIILNNYLSPKKDVILVDMGKLAFKCTPCATALLEYQLDDFAKDLKKELTNEEIVDIYKMGLDSIKEINKLIKQYGNHCQFNLKSSLVYSNSFLHSLDFKKEYLFRKNNGFSVDFINKQNNPFPFPIKEGLYCKNGGAEFNPYLFCKQLIENSKNQENIYEHTEIDMIEKQDQKLIAKTNYGNRIVCNKIVLATGFNENISPQKNLSEKFITYTIVTNPIENFEWFNRTLIQDYYDPYHYLRLLPDNRIIFGGEDTPFDIKKPINEKLTKKKYVKLEKWLIKMFPKIKDKVKIEHKFCGVFGSTDNNLGVIGKGIDPDILYFLSCGANGIINAMFGRHLIEDILNNKPNKFETLFSPLRIK